MPRFEDEFRLILNHTVKVARRTGYTATAMGDRRWTGETVIAAAMSCYWETISGLQKRKEPGDFKYGDYRMFARYNEDVQVGDLLYPVSVIVGLTLGRVTEVEPMFDFDGNTHHIEALVEKVA